MTSRATQTDFFIVGAPRCGTTAMSSYLAEHGQVNFSDPKEPLFFCSDMPGVQHARDLAGYENDFFAKSNSEVDNRRLRGEGSVWYLFSETAIPNILAYNPEAHFIVMLRNPADMLLSLHQKLFFFLDENEPDFQQAWAMQDRRASGVDIPDSCREPKLLCYRSIGMLGAQVERMLNVVRRSNIHFIAYDDFASNQRAAYEGVLRFLGLADDDRQEFPRVNANRK
ncbi:MAG: sulfotransferase, partial [Proteobacteria bacterium]|nr:sulfotransferase [Pseudomonadota bacterium]